MITAQMIAYIVIANFITHIALSMNSLGYNDIHVIFQIRMEQYPEWLLQHSYRIVETLANH